ncbi:NucA/NucB deoxyribonuclease domain-containing protein [Paenibacillus sp. Marseille-Q4541]|uniref:NucA/NucB deoxyribonuclease domain-containing protein n=1 Tax=Paenibacillus sp. Marseille-Q4541 TaxID=2831522 RepID=UPI001BAAD71E|nr:NucA/NucB deoxyribonuclease domain-containing protein [Paenibacillus sp. Marseille-Q4541]
MKKFISSAASVIIALILIAGYFDLIDLSPPQENTPEDTPQDIVQLEFPADRYPETAEHIQNAIKQGKPDICTIDRSGAEENRDESLKGIPTKKGYDRDEWPMAMCAEGGTGANIEYIDPSDNRGAGSWVGNQLEGFRDGTKVEFIFR